LQFLFFFLIGFFIYLGVEKKDRVGVCLDTCHLFAAGYDISTKKKFDQVLQEFDKEVGLKYLKAMHLNGNFSFFLQ